MITTSLCALLGIKHPILNASMAESATGELAAAVSNAGGFGMIGGSTSSGSSWLREQIQDSPRTIDPFGVGFISSFPNTDELVQVALDERVTAINHSFADPTTFVAPAHAVGIKVFAQVQTLAQAITAAEAGVDVIIAQGGEAGGHGGSLGTFALLPAIIDAVGGVPVVAAGGIAEAGRGLAAALLLGAQGAWMEPGSWRAGNGVDRHGSRTQSSRRARTTRCGPRSTIAFPTIGSRRELREGVLRNAYVETWQGRDAEIVSQRARFQDDLAAAERRADTSMVQISAGVSAGLITSAPSAGEIVRSIVQEAEDLLRARPQELLR